MREFALAGVKHMAAVICHPEVQFLIESSGVVSHLEVHMFHELVNTIEITPAQITVLEGQLVRLFLPGDPTLGFALS
jgi:hypothetical protein